MLLSGRNRALYSHASFTLTRHRSSSSGSGSGSGARSDREHVLERLCAARFVVSARGGLGPLGTELRRNVLERWWGAVVMLSRARVFGLNTPHWSASEADERRIRPALLTGALKQCVPSMELVNKKLPFGLAEVGLCSRPETTYSDTIGCPSQVTEASLVWFCSLRTSSQWLDYWTRQRLQWWRKFALGPSDFSVCDMSDEELQDGAWRGVKVIYQFPWGPETLETLLNLGDLGQLKTHQGGRNKLQCRDGRKSVIPHVLSISANMDRGLLAFLFNSLQHVQKVDSKQRVYERMVLKLHPSLAPIKVALDVGRGATSELRQLCEGLLQEFLEVGITVWPGYMDTSQSSLESLHSKYDEMGVLFLVTISENTLENGLLLVRNRDTTIKETMHISEIKSFLLKYISAAGNV